MSDLSWLNPTPHAIAVYASRPLSPVATQHSLPSGRYSLLGPDFHRLDRASFAWRTHSITSSARASSEGATDTPWARAAILLPAGACQETSFWHCRTMEMHDFPFRAALGDNKRDTSRIAKSLAVQHAS